MLAHRLRRWHNFKPALFQCVVCAGLNRHTPTSSHYVYWQKYIILNYVFLVLVISRYPREVIDRYTTRLYTERYLEDIDMIHELESEVWYLISK